MTDERTDQERYLAQRKRMAARPDFKAAPRDGLLPAALETRRQNKSHEETLADYRDKVLHLARVLVEASLFERLETFTRETYNPRAYPENTNIARFSDLLDYLKMAYQRGVTPFPADDTVLLAYLDWLVKDKQHSASTITRRLASLVKWCRWLHVDDPTRTDVAYFAIKAAKRERAAPQRQAEGLTSEHLKLAQAALDPDRPRDACDLALLFTAFYTMARRGELASFDWEHLEVKSDGKGLLWLARSKTDQAGDGSHLFVSPETVQLLRHWQSLCGYDTGPIFRGVYSNGTLSERLSDKGVSRAFKRIARVTGFDPQVFSGHSTRVGATQEMIYLGVDMATVMLTGRWSSTRMVARYGAKVTALRSGTAMLASVIEGRDRGIRKLDEQIQPSSSAPLGWDKE